MQYLNKAALPTLNQPALGFIRLSGLVFNLLTQLFLPQGLVTVKVLFLKNKARNTNHDLH